jgi:serine/threonine protein kinase
MGTLGQYELRERLGVGGFAEVWRAWDPSFEHEVALKTLLPHMAAMPDVRRRFLEEARRIFRLHHPLPQPHIIMVYQVGEVDDRPYYTMQLIDGQTLRALMNDHGPLPLDQVLTVLSPLAAALDHLHANELVHRDIKPDNVMVDAGGRVVLMDFGISRTLEGTHYQMSSVLIGTPTYMAPEQFRGEPTGPATDIYGLGVLTYQMLAGRPPFEGEPASMSYAIVHRSPPPLGGLRPDLDSPVTSVVESALAKTPSERPASAGAFVRALRQATIATAVQPAPPAPPAVEPPTPQQPAPAAVPGSTFVWEEPAASGAGADEAATQRRPAAALPVPTPSQAPLPAPVASAASDVTPGSTARSPDPPADEAAASVAAARVAPEDGQLAVPRSLMAVLVVAALLVGAGAVLRWGGYTDDNLRGYQAVGSPHALLASVSGEMRWGGTDGFLVYGEVVREGPGIDVRHYTNRTPLGSGLLAAIAAGAAVGLLLSRWSAAGVVIGFAVAWFFVGGDITARVVDAIHPRYWWGLALAGVGALIGLGATTRLQPNVFGRWTVPVLTGACLLPVLVGLLTLWLGISND